MHVLLFDLLMGIPGLAAAFCILAVLNKITKFENRFKSKFKITSKTSNKYIVTSVIICMVLTFFIGDMLKLTGIYTLMLKGFIFGTFTYLSCVLVIDE